MRSSLSTLKNDHYSLHQSKLGEFHIHENSIHMVRLEQVAAIFLAAGLAIPSYWFFWSLAGGGGYDQRGVREVPIKRENLQQKETTIRLGP